jgi:hypothetical protein
VRRGPEKMIAGTLSCDDAMARSAGSSCAKAPNSARAILLQVMLRAPTAAGNRGLTSVRGSARMATQSNRPLFGGRSGSSSVFTV